MDEFQSEKEQLDEIKRWWKENGGFMTIGLVLGVLVLGGWKYWGSYKLNRAEAASATYEELLTAVKQVNTAETPDLTYATELANQLNNDYAATPYASMGALAIAQVQVRQGDTEAAAAALHGVIEKSKDEQLKLVARLRLAKVLLMQKNADEALTVLDAVDPGVFAARYHDVRGDAYVQMGQAADARREYQAALDKYEPGLFDRQFVEMKLDDLPATDPEA